MPTTGTKKPIADAAAAAALEADRELAVLTFRQSPRYPSRRSTISSPQKAQHISSDVEVKKENEAKGRKTTVGDGRGREGIDSPQETGDLKSNNLKEENLPKRRRRSATVAPLSPGANQVYSAEDKREDVADALSPSTLPSSRSKRRSEISKPPTEPGAKKQKVTPARTTSRKSKGGDALELDVQKQLKKEVKSPTEVEVETPRESRETEEDPSCPLCAEPMPDSAVIICDDCNGEFHMACLRPPLRKVPQGDWFCAECKVKQISMKKSSKKTAKGGTKSSSHVRSKGQAAEETKENLGMVGKKILLFSKGEDSDEEDDDESDGEGKAWLTGRIIKYNVSDGRHLVSLFGDDEVRWIHLQKEFEYILCKEVIFVQVRGHPAWPAVRCVRSPKLQEEHSDKLQRGEEYCVFFETDEEGWYHTRTFIPFTLENIQKLAAKIKKKAFHLAVEQAQKELADERRVIQAEAKNRLKALQSTLQGKDWLEKRVSVFLPEVNYPQGSYCYGTVKQYSETSKKHLVAFHDLTIRPQWLSLCAPAGALHLLGDDEEESGMEFKLGVKKGILSSTRGWHDEAPKVEGQISGKGRCTACELSNGDDLLSCAVCSISLHKYCLDPAMKHLLSGMQEKEKSLAEKNGVGFVFICGECVTCRGCGLQKTSEQGKDSKWHQIEVSSERVTLCSKCIKAFESREFCPICLRSWAASDCSQMMGCDGCDLWVHAACEGMTEEEYHSIARGEHPVWAESYLCPACRLKVMVQTLDHLCAEDRTFLFLEPVTLDIAPTYFSIIKEPMDLQTMRGRAFSGEYKTPQDLRDDLELLCFNAVTFNQPPGKIWRECWRFYKAAIAVIEKYLPMTKPGRYSAQLDDLLTKQFAKKGAGTAGGGSSDALVEVPVTKAEPLKPLSCIPLAVVSVTRAQARLYSWLDICSCCGSNGLPDHMIFCVDCGEGFHRFCLVPPLAATEDIIRYWRCTNCKLCEACTHCTPDDERTLIVCDSCDRAFHLDCMQPPLKKVPEGSWFCARCVDCKCGELQEPYSWSREPRRCYRCIRKDQKAQAEARKKREFEEKVKILQEKKDICPGCMKQWKEDDLSMVQCDSCELWVHGQCDGLGPAELLKLTEDESATYFCPVCRVTTAVPCHLRSGLGESKEVWEIHKKICSIQRRRVRMREDWLEKERTREDEEKLRRWSDERTDYEEIVNLAQSRVQAIKARNFSSVMIEKPDRDFPGYLLSRARRYLRKKLYRPGPRLRLRLQASASIPTLSLRSSVLSEAVSAAAFLWVTALEPPEDSVKGLSNLLNPPLIVRDSVEQRPPLENGETKHQEPTKETHSEMKSLTHGRVAYETSKCDPKSDKTSMESLETSMSAEKLEDQKSDHQTKTEHEDQEMSQDKPEGSKGDNCLPLYSPLAEVPFTSKADPVMGWAEDTGETWRDPRQCALCREFGDSPISGRLLSMDSDQWVHANCGLWSSEVFEGTMGQLVNAYKARSRSRTMRCSHCNLSGATLGCCTLKCPKIYHYRCAREEGLHFLENKQSYCTTPGHDPREEGNKDPLMQDVDPGEPLRYLVVEENKASSSPFLSKKPKLGKDSELLALSSQEELLRVGSLVVHNWGRIVTTMPGYHTRDHLFPLGYVASRIYWSTKKPRTRTYYICEIVELEEDGDPAHPGPRGPWFKITPYDDRNNPIMERSAEAAFHIVRSRVSAQFSKEDDQISQLNAPPPHGALINGKLVKGPLRYRERRQWESYGLLGAHFFGFGLPAISRAIETLPNALITALVPETKSDRYQLRHLECSLEDANQAWELHLHSAVELQGRSKSGSARTEGFTRQKKRAIQKSFFRTTDETVGGAGAGGGGPNTKNSGGGSALSALPLAMQYRELRRRPFMERMEVHKSGIHGWGLFLKETVLKDKMIVEYQGEAIRIKVADLREKRYEEQGIGSCYMFRLDESYVVDATERGNLARFINHSCTPNAYAKIVTVDNNEKKIIIFAKRTLQPGEEVTYDYKFPIEDGSLSCNCGAPNCIGRMN